MRKFVAAVLFVAVAGFLAVAADQTADVKKADQGWAQAAASRNVDQFMTFVGDDIYACGPDGKWVHGKAAMKEMWSKMLSDPNFKLSWTVDTADVSKDGRLGYTRGTFQGSQGNTPISGGYTTVWKKDKDGKWRAAVDIATPATGQ